jgi:hypothetical protein
VVIGTFAQDGVPAETSLGTLQDEKFKQQVVIMDRNAPFLVMVHLVEGVIGVGPEATGGHHINSLNMGWR